MKNFEKYKTAEERAEAFSKWCTDNPNRGCDERCPLSEYNDDCGSCRFHWLDLEAEDEKPLPCPFCGGLDFQTKMDHEEGKYFIQCRNCWASSPNSKTELSAIIKHNRVAKAVMDAKEHLQ